MGHRFCDRAVIDLADPAPGYRQLLIRRNRTTAELAYYRCHSTKPGPAEHPGQDGWFQVAGGGNPMLARAFLAVVRADAQA